MEKLGCTIACHWCGALCWGSRDHHEHSDITKIHHSSHQPRGLAGVHNKITKELRAKQCHNVSDNHIVYYFGKEEPTIWGVAKVQDFKDWKFDPHCTYFFNDLMCW